MLFGMKKKEKEKKVENFPDVLPNENKQLLC